MENVKKIERDNISLYVLIIGLVAMLVIRDVFGIALSRYIFLCYTVFFFLVAKYEILIKMLCFVFPLLCGLPGTYIMSAALVILIMKKEKINAKQVFLVLFITAMEMFASLWYGNVDWASIVQYVSFAGILLFLLHDDAKLDYFGCVKVFYYGVFVLCVLITITGIRSAPSNWYDLFIRGAFRFGATQVEDAEGMMLSLNANSLAYYSIAGIMCSIFMLEKSEKGKRAFLILSLPFVVFAGFLTLSRSWMLVLIICLGIYGASKIKSLKSFVYTAFAFAVCFLIIYIVVNEYPQLFDGFIARFSADDVETGNGRTDLFNIYMSAFWSDIRFVLFGTGVVDYRAVIGESSSIHNGTLQILVCCGVLGFFVWILALISPVIKLIQSNRGIKICFWLPFLGVVVFIQTIQFLNPMMLMLPYLIGVYALRLGCKKE